MKGETTTMKIIRKILEALKNINVEDVVAVATVEII